ERRCDPRRLSDCEDFVRGRSKGGRGEKECRLSERCCTELQKMPRECRCEAVEGMYKEAERKERGEGEQRQRLERARALPGLCSIEPSYCEIRPS
uniref:2S albumin-like cysteine protease inhibitor (Fragments) n=1 Tax=Araucaria angustifolia TaxID=56992 RepID=CI2S_ARAAG|nr:RecName: Full=2S albumin-like cysteine protease inhibitor; Short=AaCI-2S [Araucaria angustifolia]